MDLESLRSRIRSVPDFPTPGILFRDITPLLGDASALEAAVHGLVGPFRDQGVDTVIGIESRGFIVGALAACELGVGFVPVRKAGKLPGAVLRESYSLEYGNDAVEMHADAVSRGQAVLIVDDVIATGGTARAACLLAEKAGARICGLSFLIELTGLRGRTHLGDRNVHAVLRY